MECQCFLAASDPAVGAAALWLQRSPSLASQQLQLPYASLGARSGSVEYARQIEVDGLEVR